MSSKLWYQSSLLAIVLKLDSNILLYSNFNQINSKIVTANAINVQNNVKSMKELPKKN